MINKRKLPALIFLSFSLFFLCTFHAYAVDYALTVTAQNGTVTRNPDQATYASGTSVVLTFTANAGYTFTGWSGDATGVYNPLTVVMNADKNITATSHLKYILTLSGTNCTVTKSPDKASYDYNENVTITASPNAGYIFNSWTGLSSRNPEIVAMNADKSHTGTCDLLPATLTVNPSVENTSTNLHNTCIYFRIPNTGLGTTGLTYSVKELLKDGQPKSYTQVRHFSIDTTGGMVIWYPHPSFTGVYKLTVEAANQASQKLTTVLDINIPAPAICNGTDEFCTYMKSQAIDPQGYLGTVYRNSDGWHATASTSWSSQIDSFYQGWGLQTSGGLPREVTFTNSSTSWSGLGGDNTAYGMSSWTALTLYNLFTNTDAPLFGFYPGHQSDGRLGIVSSTFGAEGHFGKFIYTYCSVGSSGSEMSAIGPYMKTSGAFRKDVFELLRQKGSLMATISMLDRLTRVAKDEQRYMSLEANPSFFISSGTRLMDMVKAANAMTIQTVPPMAKIELTMWPDPGLNGISYFENGIKQTSAFSTPMAVATFYRETQLVTKAFELNASKSFSPNDALITEYNWVVTKGNTQKIRIIPLNVDHSRVRIEIDYHGEESVPLRTNVFSNLVEVALFVRNANGQLSPPAFFTSYSMRNEIRVVENNRLKEISYNKNVVPWERAGSSTPLSYSKAWVKDVYNYGPNGELLGWDRYLANDSFTSYTADGKLITEKDPLGNPIVVKNVQYVYDSTLKVLNPVIKEEGIPAVSISPLKQSGSSGKSLNYTITIKNNDSASCAADTFYLYGSLPSGWSSVFAPNSVAISPGSTASFNWAVTPPEVIPDGNYSITASIAGNNSSYHAAVVVGTYEVGFTPEDPIYGDVSGDREVSAYDAALVCQHVLRLITLTPQQLQRAEVDGVATVTVQDAYLIAQKAVGLIDEFPVE